MPPPQLACASQLVKQLYSVLICVDVNEHICCYVHYFAKVIWHYNSNSTHIWHFLTTGLGERQRPDNDSEQTESWCKGCPQVPAKKKHPHLPHPRRNEGGFSDACSMRVDNLPLSTRSRAKNGRLSTLILGSHWVPTLATTQVGKRQRKPARASKVP